MPMAPAKNFFRRIIESFRGSSEAADTRNRDRADQSQGIVRDEKGQEQPIDAQRARQVSRANRGNDPPGYKDASRR